MYSTYSTDTLNLSLHDALPIYILVVGSPASDEVLIYTRTGCDWNLAQVITVPSTGFGFDVAISAEGDTIVISDFNGMVYLDRKHTSELQSPMYLVFRLLLEIKI